VHFMIYMYLYLYSYRRETARQLRMYAQLTRCFSAVAELLVYILPWNAPFPQPAQTTCSGPTMKRTRAPGPCVRSGRPASAHRA